MFTGLARRRGLTRTVATHSKRNVVLPGDGNVPSVILSETRWPAFLRILPRLQDEEASQVRPRIQCFEVRLL